MKVTQEKLPASQIGLEIEIPAETSKKTYEKVLKELVRNTNIPGFRKGKVPRPILLQRLGHDRVKAAVLEELIQETLEKAIAQESIESLGNYRLRTKFEDLLQDYKPGEVITFQAAVDVPPEVSLGQYQGLNIQAEEVVYNPQQVDGILEDYRNRLATLTPVEDRPAQMGDVAVIDFEGRKPPANEGEEGELIPQAVGKEFQLELKEGKFIPGFVEGIAGMNLEETKILKLQFPDNYQQKEIAGQPAVFTITLKELKEKELPELDDEFAEEITQGEFETMAGFRESLEKQDREKAEGETKINIHNAIVEELLKHTTVELPETMIQEEINNLLLQTASQIESYGMDVNQVFTRDTIGPIRERSRPEAIKNLQVASILKQIAQQESIAVAQEDLEERLSQVRASLKGKDIDAEKLNKFVSEELLTDKTLDWLRERNKIELVPEGSLSKADSESERENETPEQNESTSPEGDS